MPAGNGFRSSSAERSRFGGKWTRGVLRAEPPCSPRPFCSAELQGGYRLMAACASHPSLFQTGVYVAAQPSTLHLRGRENRWTCLCLHRFSGQGEACPHPMESTASRATEALGFSRRHSLNEPLRRLSWAGRDVRPAWWAQHTG